VHGAQGRQNPQVQKRVPGGRRLQKLEGHQSSVGRVSQRNLASGGAAADHGPLERLQATRPQDLGLLAD